MIKNNLKKLKKFFNTKTGTSMILTVVAPLLTIFVAAWAVYLLNIVSLNARSSSITSPVDATPTLVPTNTSKPDAINNETSTYNSTPSTPNNSSSYKSNPYIPGVCTKVVIPYTTRYENDPTLNEGTTFEMGGYDGYKYVCTDNSDGSNDSERETRIYGMEPTENVIRVGAKQSTMSREQCVNGYIATYGWGTSPSAQLLKANQWCALNGY